MMPADIEISSDKSRLDVELIHRFLSGTYWAAGRSRAKAIIRAMLDHPDLKALQVVLLRTRDAHGLYRAFGFAEIPRPQEMMGRYRPVAADEASSP